MEIPRYIKFDFFCVLLGLGMLIGGAYTTFKIIKEQREFLGPYSSVIALLIIFWMGAGGLLFLFGFFEMLKNYNRESEVTDLKMKSEIKSHLEEIGDWKQTQEKLNKLYGKEKERRE